jgi:hypothetical protein
MLASNTLCALSVCNIRKRIVGRSASTFFALEQSWSYIVVEPSGDAPYANTIPKTTMDWPGARTPAILVSGPKA